MIIKGILIILGVSGLSLTAFLVGYHLFPLAISIMALAGGA